MLCNTVINMKKLLWPTTVNTANKPEGSDWAATIFVIVEIKKNEQEKMFTSWPKQHTVLVTYNLKAPYLKAKQ